MKLAFFADVHIGNHKRFGGQVQAGVNERCDLALDVLDRAVTGAENEGCDALFIVGDLLDYSRPEAQVLRRLQVILGGRPDKCILVGNHEQVSTTDGDHALGPLTGPTTRIIEQPTVVELNREVEVLCVPFQPGNAHDWLPRVLRGIVAREDTGSVARSAVRMRRVLALHLGIKDEKTPPWLASAPDAVHVDVLRDLCVELSITHVFAGNWHDQRAWEFHYPETGFNLNVLQIGALVPTGWDNPGVEGYGGVAILGTKSGKIELHEHFGPRFVRPRTSAEFDAILKKCRNTDNKLFVSEDALPEELADRVQELSAIRDSGSILAFEVHPDARYAEAQARSAASAARDKDTLDEAVAAFVGKMPLPEDVSRANVLSRTRGFLK